MNDEEKPEMVSVGGKIVEFMKQNKKTDFLSDSFQEDAAGEPDARKKELSDSDKVVMEAIKALLSTTGWQIVLEGVMRPGYDWADSMLKNPKTPLEQLRYFQGYANAFEDIQRKIISLSKEEGYGVRNEEVPQS